MPVTAVTQDAAALTMTLTSEFEASVDRVWQLFADPRRLEKWWNPPGYPLTITDHDLSVGGFVRAFVIPPEGGKMHAYWRFTAVDAPRSLEWEDGFLDEQGEPNAEIPPAVMKLALTERGGGGTLMTIVIGFLSAESMQWYVDMDMAEQTSDALVRAEALLG